MGRTTRLSYHNIVCLNSGRPECRRPVTYAGGKGPPTLRSGGRAVLPRSKKTGRDKRPVWHFVEPATGFEPATRSLQNCCATIAPRWQKSDATTYCTTSLPFREGDVDVVASVAVALSQTASSSVAGGMARPARSRRATGRASVLEVLLLAWPRLSFGINAWRRALPPVPN